jgi:2-iminobutanoate/2-iminopropanoate deaminase
MALNDLKELKKNQTILIISNTDCMKTKSFLGLLILLFALNLSVKCQNSSVSLKKEKFNLDKAGEDKIGYAQAVKIGNTIYVSGSVGWGNMADALKLAYDEIGKTLKN